MGASIAQNSLPYWHDNFDRICDSLVLFYPSPKKIIGLRPLSTPLATRSETRGWLGYNWEQAGVADLIGGLTAGTGKFCGACRFLGPAGWKAIAIAVTVGGVLASVSDLIYQYGANSGYSVSIVNPSVDMMPTMQHYMI